jgi:hypothetical protein
MSAQQLQQLSHVLGVVLQALQVYLQDTIWPS